MSSSTCCALNEHAHARVQRLSEDTAVRRSRLRIVTCAAMQLPAKLSRRVHEGKSVVCTCNSKRIRHPSAKPFAKGSVCFSCHGHTRTKQISRLALRFVFRHLFLFDHFGTAPSKQSEQIRRLHQISCNFVQTTTLVTCVKHGLRRSGMHEIRHRLHRVGLSSSWLSDAKNSD